jgi:hypothetical protein
VASLEIETVALNAPAAFGVNTMLNVEFWPAAIVTGRLGPLKEKYWVEIAALLIVTGAVPVFEMAKVSVLLVPVVTLPKSRLALAKSKAPDCTWVAGLVELNPWQPTRIARLRRSSPTLAALRPFAPSAFRELVIIIKSGEVLAAALSTPGLTLCH